MCILVFSGRGYSFNIARRSDIILICVDKLLFFGVNWRRHGVDDISVGFRIYDHEISHFDLVSVLLDHLILLHTFGEQFLSTLRVGLVDELRLFFPVVALSRALGNISIAGNRVVIVLLIEAYKSHAFNKRLALDGHGFGSGNLTINLLEWFFVAISFVLVVEGNHEYDVVES